MPCCGGDAKWKREFINDHKFDYVDVDEFIDGGFMTKLKYCFVFLFSLKSILIYVLDIYTAVMLVVFKTWTNSLSTDSTEVNKRPFIRWIFVASIGVSYILLFLEMRKTRAIILSRDISYTFTSIMANRYYTLRSYAHYCFFKQIHNQKRFKDELAFFVFFSLKGWKRLFFAEAPRQVVNGYILVHAILDGVNMFLKYEQHHHLSWTSKIEAIIDYTLDDDLNRKLTFVTMGIPCLLFIISAIRTLFAAFLYLFLVCEIRGNLKEYCCHKIDKRIAELLRYKARTRARKDRIQNGAIHPTKPVMDGFEDLIMMETVKKSVVHGEGIIADEKRAMPTRSITPNFSDTSPGRLDANRQRTAQPTLPRIDLDLTESNPYGPQATGQVHGNRASRFLASSLGRNEYLEVGSCANSECSEDSHDTYYMNGSKSSRSLDQHSNSSQSGQRPSRNQYTNDHRIRSSSPTRSEASSRSRPGYAPSNNGRNLGVYIEDDEDTSNRYQDSHHSPSHPRSRSKNSRNPTVKPGTTGAVNF
ncbi:Potassium transporter [Basidiobolus ranarum]|uniref:Potassium transporter n=1 Tax=Basidiobolus ranarum TaxID=34480 RepID=A0ABR2VTT9_9FUNG